MTKPGPWSLIGDNQSFPCDCASPLASLRVPVQHHLRDQWEIRPLFCCRNISNPVPALYHHSFFFFTFFLYISWSAAHSQTHSQKLWHWIRSVWICQSVFGTGWNPRFSLRQINACVWLSHWFKFKNTTAGKYKQMKRPIYSGRRCCFSHETEPQQ